MKKFTIKFIEAENYEVAIWSAAPVAEIEDETLEDAIQQIKWWLEDQGENPENYLFKEIEG